VLGQ
jgi:hypothetical protein